MARQKLVATDIDRYKPVKNEGRLHDGNGLYLRYLKRQGKVTKTWMYTYRVGSRSAYITLGDHDATLPEIDVAMYGLGTHRLTLASAREIARKLTDWRKAGYDPKECIQREAERREAEKRIAEEAEKARQQAELARLEAERQDLEKLARIQTTNQLFDAWRVSPDGLGSWKDGGKETVRGFRKDVLPVIGHMKAQDVRKADVMRVVDAVLARGSKRMAKRYLSEMRQMFNFGVDREIVEANPTATINKKKVGGKEVMRDRHLSEAEIRDLDEKMPDAKFMPETECAVWIQLSTCCRVGEISRARWQDIDMEAGTWTITEAHSKNGKRHVIYLSDFAKAQFRRLEALKAHDVWVYPDAKRVGHVCVKSISKQVGDRQRTVPLSNRTSATATLNLSGGRWTPHDLRRTGATIMGELGVSSDVIEKCLNHLEENKMKRTYQRQVRKEDQRRAWQLLGERLQLIVSGAGNVLPMQRKAS